MSNIPILPVSEVIAKCGKCEASFHFDASLLSCPVYQPHDCPLRGGEWVALKKKLVSDYLLTLSKAGLS
jgi:hypothetical protein